MEKHFIGIRCGQLLLTSIKNMFGQTQFKQRQQKCQGRFRALVLVDPTGMETIPATSRGRIAHWKAEVVVSQEPVKSPAGLSDPAILTRLAIGFDTGRDQGMSFDRLLVEARPFTAFGIKTVRANRNEVALLGALKPASTMSSRSSHGPAISKACDSLALS